MICASCQRAGKFNADANQRVFDSVTEAEPIRAIARMWHSKCSDQKCSCQHIIGNVVKL